MTAAIDLATRLATEIRHGRRVALVVGPGVTADSVPGMADMADLADQFAAERIDNDDLTAALDAVRRTAGDRPLDRYVQYRRTFAEWVSPVEFDIVVQHAVLQAHLPRGDAPGRWERVGPQRGAQLEADLDGWSLPIGVEALGVLLATRPASFGHRILTTTFDPLLEIAIRRADGSARTVLPGRAVDPDPDGVDIVHLHGYWRPVDDTDAPGPLHDPERLPVDVLHGEIGPVDLVCVIGYDEPDATFTTALRAATGNGIIETVWATVDGNRLFPALERALRDPSTDPPAIPSPRRRARRHAPRRDQWPPDPPAAPGTRSWPRAPRPTNCSASSTTSTAGGWKAAPPAPRRPSCTGRSSSAHRH